MNLQVTGTDQFPNFSWAIVYLLLTPNYKFLGYIMIRTSYIRWNESDVLFVLDQHAMLDLFSASPLKQQCASRHVTPLGNINPWFFLLNATCLVEKQQIPIL
jgi:hypothetical protein